MVLMDRKKPFEKLMPMCMFAEGIIAFMMVVEIFFEAIDEEFDGVFIKFICFVLSIGLCLIWGHLF